MIKYEDNLAARLNGNNLQPLAGASVTVTDMVTNLPAALYEDDELTPIPQPIITDNNGYLSFRAADGRYKLTFASGANSSRFDTFTREIVLEDPADNPFLTAQELALPNGATKIGYGTRTVSDKLGEQYDVRDFGALVADDASAGSANLATLNLAILSVSAAGGGVLNVPPGTFLFSALPGDTVSDRCIVLRENVHLRGAGRGVTVLRRNDASTLMTNAPDGAFDTTHGGGENNCGISHMTLDGNAAFSPLYPANISFWFGSDNVRIHDVTFLNAPGLHGIDMNGCRYALIERCRFEGHDAALTSVASPSDPTYYPEAIQLGFETGSGTFMGLPNKHITIRDCWFGPSDTLGTIYAAIGHHSARLDVFTEDVKIQDCVIDSALALGISIYCWKRVQIEGIKFGAMPKAILFRSAKNIYDSYNVASGVSQSGEDVAISGCKFLDVSSISIDMDTGHVGASTYQKWKNITLRDLTFVSGVNTNSLPISLKWVSGVRISGMAMRGQFSRGIVSRFCDNVSISSHQIEGTALEGIQVVEVTETQFASQGLTHTWSITGGTLRNIGYSGYALACAITGVVISGTSMTNIGSVPADKRPGVSLSGFATDVLIDGVRVNSCSYGVDASASCSNVKIGTLHIMNAVSGPVRNLATGESSSSYVFPTVSANYDPASLADGAGVTTTVTVTGAALGDIARAAFSLDLQGVMLNAWVSAANTVSVRFQNETGATVDLASGTLKATVTRI